jgi:hypothetical protein
VNASVLPPDPVDASTGLTDTDPDPSADVTSTCGELARSLAVPPAVDRSCAENVCSPGLEGAVTPAAPELRLPYVIVHVPDEDRLTPVTWIVLPVRATDPHVELV